MLWVSVGIGLLISLLFAEFFGLAAVGLVVPGYIALFWDRPLQIVGTNNYRNSICVKYFEDYFSKVVYLWTEKTCINNTSAPEPIPDPPSGGFTTEISIELPL